jgi:wobble nucleotide-excising tRNase
MKSLKKYKTPTRKLCKLFLKSRNKWRLKYQNAKKDIKNLKNLNRYSKNRIKQLKMYIKELEIQLAQVEQKIDICEPNTLKRNIMCATYLYHYFLATLCLLFKSSVHIILRFKVFGSHISKTK